ncbi:hypothetical protein AAF712_015348 [Marasmius tenuissimus]|uniref:Uncharacterized protein n=1 Tax=Marasmius tenuissimus TaxID=585030 RepID=A0ABR2ZB23_9AGAR
MHNLLSLPASTEPPAPAEPPAPPARPTAPPPAPAPAWRIYVESMRKSGRSCTACRVGEGRRALYYLSVHGTWEWLYWEDGELFAQGPFGHLNRNDKTVHPIPQPPSGIEEIEEGIQTRYGITDLEVRPVADGLQVLYYAYSTSQNTDIWVDCKQEEVKRGEYQRTFYKITPDHRVLWEKAKPKLPLSSSTATNTEHPPQSPAASLNKMTQQFWIPSELSGGGRQLVQRMKNNTDGTEYWENPLGQIFYQGAANDDFFSVNADGTRELMEFPPNLESSDGDWPMVNAAAFGEDDNEENLDFGSHLRRIFGDVEEDTPPTLQAAPTSQSSIASAVTIKGKGKARATQGDKGGLSTPFSFLFVDNGTLNQPPQTQPKGTSLFGSMFSRKTATTSTPADMGTVATTSTPATRVSHIPIRASVTSSQKGSGQSKKSVAEHLGSTSSIGSRRSARIGTDTVEKMKSITQLDMEVDKEVKRVKVQDKAKDKAKTKK